MKRKMPRKLTLCRETLMLATNQISGADGPGTLAGQICSNPCIPRNGGDTAQSCNVFSCASCLIVTCGC